MSYNLKMVTELLDKAFSMSELETLVFDLFYDQIDNFSRPKPKYIRGLVDYANRQGEIEAVLNFVKDNNAYQYGQYINKVRTSVSAPSNVGTQSTNDATQLDPNTVFISYSRKDNQFAQQLNQALRQEGIPTWIDQVGIRGADEWENRITQAINGCGTMIVIISPDSMVSEWVQRELKFADDEKKRILPILHRDVVLPDWYRFRFSAIQWVDFTNKSFADGITELRNILS